MIAGAIGGSRIGGCNSTTEAYSTSGTYTGNTLVIVPSLANAPESGAVTLTADTTNGNPVTLINNPTISIGTDLNPIVLSYPGGTYSNYQLTFSASNDWACADAVYLTGQQSIVQP